MEDNNPLTLLKLFLFALAVIAGIMAAGYFLSEVVAYYTLPQ